MSKTYLITGGARGQGRAIALKAASQGANVALVDVCHDLNTVPYTLGSEDDLDTTRTMVEQLGAGCLTVVGDVRSQQDMDAAVTATIDRFGALDVLCASAGVHSFVPLWEMDDDTWSTVLDVNLTGVWRGIKAVAPHMIAREQGSIVITSSVMGHETGKDLAHYAASKHGVLGLMKSTAYELGRYGVRCNAVLPSVVHTAMGENPATRKWIFGRDDATTADYIQATKHWHLLPGRPGLPPSAIADAVVWLSSDEARYITGVELPVDAGHLQLQGFNHEVVEREGEAVGPWY